MISETCTTTEMGVMKVVLVASCTKRTVVTSDVTLDKYTLTKYYIAFNNKMFVTAYLAYASDVHK